jgi:hypothetical protein
MTTAQLPAPKREITPEDESTVQMELEAEVANVSAPALELVVAVGVSVAPGLKIATFEFGYVSARVGVARVIARSAATKVIAYFGLFAVVTAPCWI